MFANNVVIGTFNHALAHFYLKDGASTVVNFSITALSYYGVALTTQHSLSVALHNPVFDAITPGNQFTGPYNLNGDAILRLHGGWIRGFKYAITAFTGGMLIEGTILQSTVTDVSFERHKNEHPLTFPTDASGRFKASSRVVMRGYGDGRSYVLYYNDPVFYPVTLPLNMNSDGTAELGLGPAYL